MKKLSVLSAVFILLSLVLISCDNTVDNSASSETNSNSMLLKLLFAGNADFIQGLGSVVWNSSEADKAVAAGISAVQNMARNNASGIKITSNARSDDFPGIYFIWDSKQKDSGYLKVAAGIFTLLKSFTLTAKEANTYWDFTIAMQNGQQLTSDNCYVFFIPRVYNNKNINMVFVSEWAAAAEPVTPIVPKGFTGAGYVFYSSCVRGINYSKSESKTFVSNEAELNDLFGEAYCMGYNEEREWVQNNDLQNLIGKYDGEYFKDYQLLPFTFATGGGAGRIAIKSVVYEGGVLTISADSFYIGMGTAAITGWFAILEIKKVPEDTTVESKFSNTMFNGDMSSFEVSPSYYLLPPVVQQIEPVAPVIDPLPEVKLP